MRIRKRAVPLPLSLLSPVPFSDPHLRLVQLPGHPHSNSQPPDHLEPPPSDDPGRLIRYDRDSAVIPQPHSSVEIKTEKNKEQREDDKPHTSKQSRSGAVADNVVPPPPSTPSNPIEVVASETRWCDGDKAIPLKKRKVSFEMNGAVVTREAKMKSKTNKKCPLQNASEEEESDDDDDEEEGRQKAMEVGNNKKKSKTKSKKSNDSKGKKGGSIMEGSRCSRVNGRGWRCFQPTLVGYSLCEHHLGKGRLRSMSTVRFRASSSSSEKPSPTSKLPEEKSSTIALGANNTTVGNAIQEESSCYHGPANKKRTRLGVVKARSLSSLLCQPETPVKQHATQ